MTNLGLGICLWSEQDKGCEHGMGIVTQSVALPIMIACVILLLVGHTLKEEEGLSSTNWNKAYWLELLSPVAFLSFLHPTCLCLHWELPWWRHVFIVLSP